MKLKVAGLFQKFHKWRKDVRETDHVRSYDKEIEPEWKKDNPNLGKFMASFVSPAGEVFLYYLDEKQLSIVKRVAIGKENGKFVYDLKTDGEHVGNFSFNGNIIKVGEIKKKYRGLGLSKEAIKLLLPKMKADYWKLHEKEMPWIEIKTEFKKGAEAAKRIGFELTKVEKRKNGRKILSLIPRKSRMFYLRKRA